MVGHQISMWPQIRLVELAEVEPDSPGIQPRFLAEGVRGMELTEEAVRLPTAEEMQGRTLVVVAAAAMDRMDGEEMGETEL